ncbi:hypothetical protein GC102_24425 [Paenibacillus sp. LMG 31460]|uniref:Uncharacterized protein n=1 Tax=Paenibacillus germinis TaxID=2654979 RepID=A0ABX1Z931_9BACL|nr:hypothetical protein [Paenibacillus germinis]NOU88869.1 hypothetical protein [Paenibacillus germinis]
MDSQDDEEVSDWQAKIVWNNYHSCTLSSTYRGEASGFQVGKELNQFDIKWEGKIALTYAGQNDFLHSFEANSFNGER